MFGFSPFFRVGILFYTRLVWRGAQVESNWKKLKVLFSRWWIGDYGEFISYDNNFLQLCLKSFSIKIDHKWSSGSSAELLLGDFKLRGSFFFQCYCGNYKWTLFFWLMYQCISINMYIIMLSTCDDVCTVGHNYVITNYFTWQYMIFYHGSRTPKYRCSVIELDYQCLVFWLLFLLFVTLVVPSVINSSVNLRCQVNRVFTFHLVDCEDCLSYGICLWRKFHYKGLLF